MKRLLSLAFAVSVLARCAFGQTATLTVPAGTQLLPAGGQIALTAKVVYPTGTNTLQSVQVVSGGSGYTSAPTVTFAVDPELGETGSGATATAVVSGGVVTAINVTNPGSGYSNNPTVGISGGGGSGAQANAVVLLPAAIGFSVNLPAGWRYVKTATLPEGVSAVLPGVGAQLAEWAFSAFTPNSLEWSFTVAYPANLTTDQVIVVDPKSHYRSGGTVSLTVPNLTISPTPVRPAITTHPVNKEVAVGGTVTFEAAASGVPAPSFQWRKNGTAITGATNSTFTIASVARADAGLYTVIARNTAGDSDPSNAATLTVNYAPVITTQPVNKTIIQGGTATFTVVADALPAATYQWQFMGTEWSNIGDGMGVSGATTATLSFTPPPGYPGVSLRCVVTNGVGSVTSNEVAMVVQSPPVFGNNPTDASGVVNATATFEAAATGNPQPTYQWERKPAGQTTFAPITNGGAYSGATTTMLTVSSLALSMNGDQFRCVATNGIGTAATSTVATLSVSEQPAPPAVTTQPANVTKNAGQTATFTVVMSGFPSPTYQWKKGGVDLADGGKISGTKTATLTITNVQPSDEGEYSVYGSNSQGNATSNGATLTVNTAPVFGTHPSNASPVEGGSVTFSASATGKPAPTYQWQKGTTNIAGATNATYTISNVRRADAGTYRVLATNSVTADVASNAATLDVLYPAEITTQPASVTVKQGQPATFTVAVTANPTATFQWYKGTELLTGKTAATLTIDSAQPADEGSYTVQVTNGIEPAVTSAAATLTVNTMPSFTAQPVSTTVNQAASASFTVVAAGKPTPTIQWKKGTGAAAVALTNGTKYSGVTTGTLTIADVQPDADSGSYFAVATNSVGETASNVATLGVNTAPTITTQPTAKASFLVGDPLTLTVVATGVPAPTYQWQKGTTPISGATNATFSITSLSLSDAGSYSVVVTNLVRSVTSTPVTFAVYQPPTITGQPQNQTIVAGQSATFTVVATGDPAPTYQWRKDGMNIAGATNATLSLTNVPYNGGGSFTVALTNLGGSRISNPAVLTVNPVAPSITGALTASGIVGTSFVYQINANTTSATYAATGLPAGLTINGTTGTILGAPTTAGAADVTISATNVTGTDSKTLRITITPPIPVITSAASATAKVGTDFNFTVVASNSPTGFTATGLPPGLTLNATTGAITGRPTQGGNYTVTVTATNATGSVSSQLVIVVDAATLPLYKGSLLLGAVEGTAYSFIPVFENGPITGYTSTPLPAGLTLNATTGAITGTPTESGTFTVRLTATNAGGSTTVELTLTVNPAPAAPVITSASSASAVTGTAFSFQLTSNGTPAASSYAAKELPALGLSLNATTGVISGTPTGPGTLILEVSATNSVGTGPRAALVITVSPHANAPVVTSAPVVTGRVGDVLTYDVTATNSPTSYVQLNGTLPEGLAFNATTGRVTGTPTKVGRTEVVFAASNADGRGLGLIVAFNIAPALAMPTITSVGTAMGQVGQPFQYEITATNAPTSFTATGLPAWAGLNGATGLITGIPSEATTQPIKVTLAATNADGTGTPKDLYLTVAPAPATPTVTSPLYVTGRVGVDFTYTITASDSPTSFLALNLPDGLSVASTTGVISGKPTKAGSFVATVRAANNAGLGEQASLTFNIISALQAPVITSFPAAQGKVGEDFSYQVTATPAPITSYAVYGDLPSGLAFNTLTGALTGKPVNSGLYGLVITATNAGGTSLPQPLVLNIVAAGSAPVITSPIFARANVGVDFTYQITASATPAFPAAPFPAPFLLEATNLPAGLAVNPSTGLIQGKPESVGLYTASLVGTNSAGTGPVRELVILVLPAPSAPVITSATVVSAKTGNAFSYQITATESPTTFDVLGAPAWMTVNSQTGLIAGTPPKPGVVKLQMLASNSAGTSKLVPLTIHVAPVPTAPVINSTRSARADVNKPFTYQIGATNSPTSFVVSGLPAGLTLNPTTGVISGVPTISGPYEVEMTAINASGASLPVKLALTVTATRKLVVP